MEATLIVIGLNHRTAPLAMRERFWIGETRRYEVLRRLKMAEGIEEIVVIATCCRTEFLIWSSDPTLAANSVLQYLGSEHGLKLTEWQHFYRLLDEAALAHIFGMSAGIECYLGEPHITAQLKASLEQARAVGAAGHFLDAALEMALAVAGKIREQTEIGSCRASIPAATAEVGRQVFGTFQGRKILLLGASDISAACARKMVEEGAQQAVVIDQSPSKAEEIAAQVGGRGAAMSDRWKCLLEADIVVTATGCPHVVVTREEAERIAEERNRVALVILDLGMPRDVDPEVRRVDGILLYDLEGLARLIRSTASERPSDIEAAEKIVAEEAHAFRSKLKFEKVVPTIVALRQRLDELCRQELDSFIQERGPFTREQDQSLHAITAQVIQKIASSLARELKDVPEKDEQERMTAAVARLFHLQSPKPALAGTRLEKQTNERNTHRTIAINS